ncbi:MAG: N-acetyltransferase, partial [Planctomycetota bacterium]|nr:N-acetyltransferase [Planctomycetota bacterium]
MPITVRPEAPGEVEAIRRVNDAAFGRPDEGRLVDALRGAARPFVSLVAREGDEVVGHALFTPVTVGATSSALALGPMAVVPGRQGVGVGSALVRAGLDACRALGHEVVFVLGHPGYYPRFGFVPAGPRGLTGKW